MWKLPDGHFLKLDYNYIAKINMSDDFISGYLYRVDKIIKDDHIPIDKVPTPFVFSRIKDRSRGENEYGLLDMQGNFIRYDYLEALTNGSNVIVFSKSYFYSDEVETGLLDIHNNEIIIGFENARIRRFQKSDIFLLYIDGKYGAINSQGDMIVDCIYPVCGGPMLDKEISVNFLKLYRNNEPRETFLINKTGKFVKLTYTAYEMYPNVFMAMMSL